MVGVRLGVGCPCPPVGNDIVTPRHLLRKTLCVVHVPHELHILHVLHELLVLHELHELHELHQRDELHVLHARCFAITNRSLIAWN